MAAARCCRLALRGPRLSLHTAAEAAVAAPEVTGPQVAAVPVARYPPVVASLTAKSKAARQRRVERWQATVHAAESVDEKLRILTKMQFMKYVVYPQTFALNADRWYQGFTKTVFVSGLPAPPAEPAPALDLEALRAAACDCLLQEHFYLRRKRRAPLYQDREAVASPFLDQLVAAVVGLLSAHNPALATAALGEPWGRHVGREWWGLFLSFSLRCHFGPTPLPQPFRALPGAARYNSHCPRNLDTGFWGRGCHLLAVQLCTTPVPGSAL